MVIEAQPADNSDDSAKFSFRIPKALYDEFVEAAWQQRLTRSQLILIALREYLASFGGRSPGPQTRPPAKGRET